MKINSLIKNKIGSELSLSTIVIFILAILTLIVIIMFFSEHFSSNSEAISNTGKDAISNAINGK